LSDTRIDKWLWAVRIFKTRNQAAEACRKGRVIISDIDVKPSRILKINDHILVRKPPVTYQFKVVQLIDNRVAAKIATTCYEDLTPDEEKNKLLLRNIQSFNRERGSGRPTKKERREIDNLLNTEL
jgi:ribosome-associated heat shock protein Hsp15